MKLFATQADTGSIQNNTVDTVQCKRIKAKKKIKSKIISSREYFAKHFNSLTYN